MRRCIGIKKNGCRGLEFACCGFGSGLGCGWGRAAACSGRLGPLAQKVFVIASQTLIDDASGLQPGDQYPIAFRNPIDHSVPGVVESHSAGVLVGPKLDRSVDSWSVILGFLKYSHNLELLSFAELIEIVQTFVIKPYGPVHTFALRSESPYLANGPPPLRALPALGYSMKSRTLSSRKSSTRRIPSYFIINCCESRAASTNGPPNKGQC